MRWTSGRRSDNVEDRRGVRLSGGKVKTGGIGILLLALVGMYFGIDPSLILNIDLRGNASSQHSANHANRVRNILEPGDVEEALNAASMIGDDNLQKKTRGYVVPDSFTHGTSKQRVAWFRQGLNRGEMRQCNTFK